MDSKRYCVYLHKNKVTGVVYYIGSGVQNKREFHFSSRSKAWHEIHDSFGTDVEIYQSGMTLSESRRLEQELIDSGEYLSIVNSRRVTSILKVDEERVKQLLVYDPTSKTCLRRVKTTSGTSKVGDEAGYLIFSSDGRPRSACVKIDGKDFKCSRIIWVLFYGQITDSLVIDHIDGNPHNNTIENLRCVTLQENSRNKAKVLNKQLPSGIIKRTDRITASVHNEGKTHTSSFSIKLYSEEVAVEKAIAWRISKLKELGIFENYSPRHIGIDNFDDIDLSISRLSTSSSLSDNIWIKRDSLGTPVSVSSGIGRKPRKYFKITKDRPFEEAMFLARQHLESVLQFTRTSQGSGDDNANNLENAP